jgi:hypothetical protein
MRTLAAILLAVVSSAVAYAGPPIDLNIPNALKSLQARNPDHYRRAAAILSAVQERVSANMAPWIEANFDATEVECVAWHVSNPPKLTVSFTLDKTRYTATVVTKALEPKVLR